MIIPRLRFRDLLHDRGLNAATIVALRNSLHPDDATSEFRNINDVAAANALSMYDRMQDGPVIDHETLVASFAEMDGGLARLTDLRTFMLRAPGNVPGDIVYNYDGASLLHSFIARAVAPCFYDAIDHDGLDDLLERLIVRWPLPLTEHIVSASNDALDVVAM